MYISIYIYIYIYMYIYRTSKARGACSWRAGSTLCLATPGSRSPCTAPIIGILHDCLYLWLPLCHTRSPCTAPVTGVLNTSKA